MHAIIKATLTITAALIGSVALVAHAAEPVAAPIVKTPTTQAPTTTAKPIVLKHGDCTWVEPLALEAGWQPHQLPRLIHIIKRESGCCPNRRGGDAVDKDCNITKVVDWSHRSDTGLLQINGVNYDISRNKWAAVCTKMGICEQEPLLDPLTNLRAGKLLHDIAGWQPWRLNPQT
jgi:hypothetical protein